MPGDLLLSPIALVALVVVLVNDRVLKVSWSSGLSGKLSDLAGLVYFPLFAVAAAEAVRWLRRRDWQLTWRAVAKVALATGVAFIAIKCWSPAAAVYRPIVGAAVWPLHAIASLVGDDGLPSFTPAPLVMDLSDLLALPMLVLPVLVARRIMRGSTAMPPLAETSVRASGGCPGRSRGRRRGPSGA